MKKYQYLISTTASALLFLATCPSVMAVMGGLTYGYSNWPAGASYYNIDQNLRIDTAPSLSSGQGWFWSNQFSIGTNVGYMGLQQLPDGTRLAIFSIWDTTNAVANTTAGFNSVSFGGEGTGMSIRGPYPWVTGHTYRLRIWLQGNDWWGAWIQDQITGVETYLGQIQNQQDPGQLLNSTITFTEHFSGGDTCSTLAANRTTWSRPTANNGNVSATSVTGVVSSSPAVVACGKQIVAASNQGGQTGVTAQIICAAGAQANLLGKGSCWRYGDYSQSCTQVCSANGIDTTFWPNGQNLSLSQCSKVHSAFGNLGNVKNNSWKGNGAGCIYYRTGQKLYNVTNPAWNANQSSSLAKRFCGCAG